MACVIGIDVGSVYTKGVLLRDSEPSATAVVLSGGNYRTTAERVREELLAGAGAAEGDIGAAVATGTGGGNVHFATQRTSDIVCTARGLSRVFPSARTAIDVAGQSTKVVRLDEQGLVVNFVASEKCAAGSGQFVEAVANVLRIDLSEFGALSLESRSPVVFSTGCAVFGESEAVSRVAQGVAKEDIAAGVNRALAEKAASLCARVGLEEPCALCGGGALNIGLVKAVESELGIRLLVPSEPQTVTALGAALMAEASLAAD